MQAAWRLDSGLSIPETVGICDLSRASAQLKAISVSLARHMILNSTLWMWRQRAHQGVDLREEPVSCHLWSMQAEYNETVEPWQP